MLFKKLAEIWAIPSRAARSRAQTVMCAGAAALGLAIAAAPVCADPRSELAQARHELAISEQVLARMNERTEAARTDPAAGSVQRERLDEQVARVQALVAANRERVRILSQTVASLPEGTAQAVRQGGKPSSATTQAEEVAALEARLGGSLAEFDQLLLEEARRAKDGAHGQSAPQQASCDAEHPGIEGGGAGGGVASRGGVAGSKAPGAKDRADRKSAPQQSGGEAGRPRIEGSEPVGTAARPPDVGDGADDDVVARQIRRAAESESDPALREKLWDEYRKYKQGSKG
jgi:hypothetical protein